MVGDSWSKADFLDAIDRAHLAAQSWSKRADLFLQAAAVVTSFDFDGGDIQPALEPNEDDNAFQELVNQSLVVASDLGQAAWTLAADVRRRVLTSLGNREDLVRTLELNEHRPDTVDQRMFEAYMRGNAPPLAEQTTDELEAAMDAVTWLDGIVPGLPPAAEVAEQLEIARFESTFTHLAGEHFAGRKGDLQRLQRYVGVIEGAGAVQTLKEWVKIERRDPYVIFGPAGVGKSTLISRFIIEHANLPDERRIPFAYLDFDDATLVSDAPTTLLAEMARQIRLQYPDARMLWRDFEDFLREELRRDSSRPRGELDVLAERPIEAQVGDLLGDQRQREAGRIEQFSDLLRKTLGTADSESPPLLVVLDSFEEIQYRTKNALRRLWTWLDRLQDAVPRLRAVISGRDELGDAVKGDIDRDAPLRLADFDVEASAGYLESRGVTDPKVARAIAAQLGGNPLTLALAAQVVELEGPDAVGSDGIDGVHTRRLLRKTAQAKIQGVLYKRILKHLHEGDYPGLRKLAHPGLVLRRLTPALILDVLAGPIELDIHDLNQAERLFEGLRRELSLTHIEPDGSLSHRRDVRQLVLREIEQDEDKDVIERIHRAAIEYYERHLDDPAAPAERLYHLLKVGDGGPELDGLWEPSLESSLRLAIDELPATGKAFLARHMGLSKLAFEVREAADLETWERDARHRALVNIRRGDFQAARDVLAERGARSPNSELHVVRLLADLAGGDYESVHGLLPIAIDEAEAAGDRRTRMLYHVIEAHLVELSEQFSSVDVELECAGALAGAVGDRRVALAVDLHRLDLPTSPNHTDRQAIRNRAIASCNALSIEQLHSNESLVQSALGVLGREDPEFLRFNIGLISTRRLETDAVDEFITRLVALDEVSHVLARTRLGDEIRRSPTAPGSLGERLSSSTPSQDLLDDLLSRARGDEDVVAAVATLLAGAKPYSCFLDVYRWETDRSYNAVRRQGGYA